VGYNFGKDTDSSKIPRTAINVPARPGSIDPKVQQVDVFPLDAFSFDDPNKTANPRVMLKEPWTWEVQAEIDALDAGVVKLGVQVQLSALSASRTRAGLVEPSSLTATAVRADGVAYTGRYKIFLRYNGAETIVAYTSSADELSKVYLIPATVEISSVVYDVEGVIVRVYTAGGTAELLDEKECLVTLKIGSSSVYWGALTTAPTTNFLEGDTYWDDRDPVTSGPAEGGVLRVYSSGSWIEFVSSASGYTDAAAKAITDMMIWARAKGVTTLAAANAVFGSIAAAEAFITVLEAQTLSVSGTVKTGVGAADNARIAIIDETGTSGLAFSGTGVNDMAIIDDGSVDGAFTVKITKGSDIASPTLGATGPGGGKIFYIDLVNKFALEAAPADIGRYPFSNIINASCYAGNTMLRGGYTNTNLIIAQAGFTSGAAKYCADYTNNGKTDWFLPNILELDKMWQVLGSTSALRTANGFEDDNYGSSLEYSSIPATHYQAVNFISGVPPGFAPKDVPCLVRPIRIIDLHEYFQWREDSHAWSSDVEIVAGAQTTLTGYDIKIAFGSQLGHVLNDQWTFIQGSMIGLSIRDVAGVEYVHAEDGQWGIAAPQTVTATGNVTLGLLDNSVLVNTAAAVTITIPAGCAIGHEIRIMRTVTSANAITVARSGSETIEGATTFITHGSWAATTLNLSEVVLKKVFSTEWRFVGGEISGSTSIGSYIKYPSGVMRQRGNAGTLSSDVTITLPIPDGSAVTPSLSGSVIPISSWQPFEGYPNGTSTIVIHPVAVGNGHLWVWDGRWRA
jgi:hypothetical protein